MSPPPEGPKWVQDLMRTAKDVASYANQRRSSFASSLRWCPGEWRAVMEEYKEHGAPLDYFRLAGAVQYFGASTPERPHRLNPESPASSFPARTTDLADRLRRNPGDEEAARALADRGYRVNDRGELAAAPKGKGAPSKLWRTIARELVLYLRPRYKTVAEWDQDTRVPERLVGHVHTLLVPYYPDLAPRHVRSAIEDLDR